MSGTAPAGELLSADGIDGAFVPEPAPGIQTAECDGGAVLYDEARARLHVLDPLAALIWGCFDGTASLDEIVADVSEVLEIDAGDARQAVSTLTRLVASRGLLAGIAAPPDDSTASA